MVKVQKERALGERTRKKETMGKKKAEEVLWAKKE
jgi:hypothetical protein